MSLAVLALRYILLNLFRRLPIVYKIQSKFKDMQHKHNLWFVDCHVLIHTHTDTHLDNPPPTHQSVHSAGTNSNRLQRDCGPELWVLGGSSNRKAMTVVLAAETLLILWFYHHS